MSFERDIIIFLQNFQTPFLNGVFKIMAYFFDWPIVVFTALLLLIFKQYKSTAYFLTLQGAGCVVQLILKKLVARPRPYVTYLEISNILPASNSSFPSGHSITCMMLVVFLFVFLKSKRLKNTTRIFLNIMLIILPILCLINRMYLGQHYLTDCLAGFAIAILIGFIVTQVFYKKPKSLVVNNEEKKV